MSSTSDFFFFRFQIYFLLSFSFLCKENCLHPTRDCVYNTKGRVPREKGREIGREMERDGERGRERKGGKERKGGGMVK